MRIIKRKKGNKEYFYLQHSVRIKSKIVTKEKYLGKKIPKDIKKRISTLKKEFLNLNSNLEKLEKIRKNFQKEWTRLPKSVQEKQKQEIAIAFTYNTNAIEGSKITLEETREIIQEKIAPNQPIRDIKETEAHNSLFLDMLKKKEKLATKKILQWHYSIFKETKPDIAGKIRTYFITIAGHIPPDYRKVNMLIKKLISYVNKENKEKKLNPVEIAARVHYRFEKIHPFGDGNGRIGRLLMNYILWHSGYPMLIIENKKREAYYKALKKDEDAFTSHFLRTYIKVHRRFLR